MTASADTRAEWHQMTVPDGTGSNAVRSGSSTGSNADRPELAYARQGMTSAQIVSTGPLQEAEKTLAPRVVVLPVHAPPSQRFIPLSRREGIVLEIRDDEFDARLVDLDGEDGDLDATFAVEELSPDDRPLLRPGAVFYWTIGYFDDQVRRRTRVSDLRFRRLPSDDRTGLAEAEREADQIRRELGLA